MKIGWTAHQTCELWLVEYHEEPTSVPCERIGQHLNAHNSQLVSTSVHSEEATSAGPVQFKYMLSSIFLCTLLPLPGMGTDKKKKKKKRP